MPTLEAVLDLVRDARDNVACGRVNDAAWLFEAVEDDLRGLCAPAVPRRPAARRSRPCGVRRGSGKTLDTCN